MLWAISLLVKPSRTPRRICCSRGVSPEDFATVGLEGTIAFGSFQTSPAATVRIAWSSEAGELCFSEIPEIPRLQAREHCNSFMPAVTIRTLPRYPAALAADKKRDRK